MSIQQVLLGAGGAGRVTASYTYATDTAYSYLNLSSISGYVAGRTDITVTINSGVYVYGPVIQYVATQYPGIEIVGGTTGDTVTIVNNGFILGAGGCGYNPTDPKQPFGYPAIIFSSTVNSYTINNTNASAYIAGGGGVGGEFVYNYLGSRPGGGGGAGGGIGGNSVLVTCNCCSPAYTIGTGGAGGGPGSAGSNGVTNSIFAKGAGGGGRILPGTGGSGTGAGGGAGGAGGFYKSGAGTATGGSGGSGSSAGSDGSTYNNNTQSGGGGGGWGAVGGTAGGSSSYGTFVSPGNGGKAVNLNGKTVTWVSGDTARVYGAVS